MQQTPAHDRPNPDLLAVMPTAERVVEVGCSRGALARAYKQRHPDSHYLGIEIDPTYAAEARAHQGPLEVKPNSVPELVLASPPVPEVP
jgi:tRNA G46 methylase TrmB